MHGCVPWECGRVQQEADREVVCRTALRPLQMQIDVKANKTGDTGVSTRKMKRCAQSIISVAKYVLAICTWNSHYCYTFRRVWQTSQSMLPLLNVHGLLAHGSQDIISTSPRTRPVACAVYSCCLRGTEKLVSSWMWPSGRCFRTRCKTWFDSGYQARGPFVSGSHFNQETLPNTAQGLFDSGYKLLQELDFSGSDLFDV